MRSGAHLAFSLRFEIARTALMQRGDLRGISSLMPIFSSVNLVNLGSASNAFGGPIKMKQAIRSLSLPLSALTAIGAGFSGGAALASAYSLEDPVDTRIVGGEETKTCHFPSVAFLKVSAGACTGTLVHPKVLTTANHCINRNGEKIKVTFGETHRGGSFTVGATCTGTTGGNKSGPPGKDFAFCVLDKEVTNVPIVPILMGCEVEALKKGNDIQLVGFGATSSKMQGAGTKRQVITPIHSDFGEGGYDTEILVGNREKGACSGDSGGPAFVDLRTIPEFADKPGAGWRVFGVTSRMGPGGSMCASTTYYGGIHKWVEWVEEETGIDVTPCFDADGTWAPSENCKDFPDPEAGGSWETCDAGKLSGWSHTCGENPHDDGEGGGGESGDGESGDGESGGQDSSKSKQEPDPSQGDPSEQEPSEKSPEASEEENSEDDASEDEGSEEQSAQSDAPDASKGDGSGNADKDKDGGCRLDDVAPAPWLGLISLLSLGLLRRRRD